MSSRRSGGDHADTPIANVGDVDVSEGVDRDRLWTPEFESSLAEMFVTGPATVIGAASVIGPDTVQSQDPPPPPVEPPVSPPLLPPEVAPPVDPSAIEPGGHER